MKKRTHPSERPANKRIVRSVMNCKKKPVNNETSQNNSESTSCGSDFVESTSNQHEIHSDTLEVRDNDVLDSSTSQNIMSDQDKLDTSDNDIDNKEMNDSSDSQRISSDGIQNEYIEPSNSDIATEELNDADEINATEELNDADEINATEELNDADEINTTEELNDADEINATEGIISNDIPIHRIHDTISTNEDSSLNDIDEINIKDNVNIDENSTTLFEYKELSQDKDQDKILITDVVLNIDDNISLSNDLTQCEKQEKKVNVDKTNLFEDKVLSLDNDQDKILIPDIVLNVEQNISESCNLTKNYNQDKIVQNDNVDLNLTNLLEAKELSLDKDQDNTQIPDINLNISQNISQSGVTLDNDLNNDKCIYLGQYLNDNNVENIDKSKSVNNPIDIKNGVNKLIRIKRPLKRIIKVSGGIVDAPRKKKIRRKRIEGEKTLTQIVVDNISKIMDNKLPSNEIVVDGMSNDAYIKYVRIIMRKMEIRKIKSKKMEIQSLDAKLPLTILNEATNDVKEIKDSENISKSTESIEVEDTSSIKDKESVNLNASVKDNDSIKNDDFEIDIHIDESADLDSDVIESDAESENSNCHAIQVNLPKMCMDRSLCVSGLSKMVRAQDLQNVFQEYGRVIGTKILLSPKFINPRNIYGYVRMETVEHCNKCLENADKLFINNEKIFIEKVTDEMTIKRKKPLKFIESKIDTNIQTKIPKILTDLSKTIYSPDEDLDQIFQDSEINKETAIIDKTEKEIQNKSKPKSNSSDDRSKNRQSSAERRISSALRRKELYKKRDGEQKIKIRNEFEKRSHTNKKMYDKYKNINKSKNHDLKDYKEFEKNHTIYNYNHERNRLDSKLKEKVYIKDNERFNMNQVDRVETRDRYTIQEKERFDNREREKLHNKERERYAIIDRQKGERFNNHDRERVDIRDRERFDIREKERLTMREKERSDIREKERLDIRERERLELRERERLELRERERLELRERYANNERIKLNKRDRFEISEREKFMNHERERYDIREKVTQGRIDTREQIKEKLNYREKIKLDLHERERILREKERSDFREKNRMSNRGLEMNPRELDYKTERIMDRNRTQDYKMPSRGDFSTLPLNVKRQMISESKLFTDSEQSRMSAQLRLTDQQRVNEQKIAEQKRIIEEKKITDKRALLIQEAEIRSRHNELRNNEKFKKEDTLRRADTRYMERSRDNNQTKQHQNKSNNTIEGSNLREIYHYNRKSNDAMHNQQSSYPASRSFSEKRIEDQGSINKMKIENLQKLEAERQRITMEYKMLEENRKLYEQNLKMKLDAHLKKKNKDSDMQINDMSTNKKRKYDMNYCDLLESRNPIGNSKKKVFQKNSSANQKPVYSYDNTLREPEPRKTPTSSMRNIYDQTAKQDFQGRPAIKQELVNKSPRKLNYPSNPRSPVWKSSKDTLLPNNYYQ